MGGDDQGTPIRNLIDVDNVHTIPLENFLDNMRPISLLSELESFTDNTPGGCGYYPQFTHKGGYYLSKVGNVYQLVTQIEKIALVVPGYAVPPLSLKMFRDWNLGNGGSPPVPDQKSAISNSSPLRFVFLGILGDAPYGIWVKSDDPFATKVEKGPPHFVLRVQMESGTSCILDCHCGQFRPHLRTMILREAEYPSEILYQKQSLLSLNVSTE